MTEKQPVLALHGVGNRGKKKDFEDRVKSLEGRLPDHIDLIPAYWGDLAAEPDHFRATLTDVRDAKAAVRDDLEQAAAHQVDVDLALALLGEGVAVRAADPYDTVVAGAVAAVREPPEGGQAVRDDESSVAEAVRAAVAESWGELQWLPRIANDTILRSAGEAVARVANELPAEAAAAEAPLVRDEETRDLGDRFKQALKSALKGIDDVVGDVVGELGGRLNHALRSGVGGGFIGFFGDIIAYLSARTAIQERIREYLPHGGDYGSAEKPIHAIGHSLGGVILFDMAVDGEPLHLDSLVTFGSQASFFHAIARRSTAIAEFDGTKPVKLPATMNRWINLWEPLDVVAFVEKPIFVLADGSAPDDRRVEHDNSSGLWTHSAYWDRDELVRAIGDAVPSK